MFAEHRVQLTFSEILARSHDEPMVICWDKEGTGTSFAVATRLPSSRRDVVKVRITEVDGSITDIKLRVSETHELVDASGIAYTLYEVFSEAELASCRRVLAAYQLQEDEG